MMHPELPRNSGPAETGCQKATVRQQCRSTFQGFRNVGCELFGVWGFQFRVKFQQWQERNLFAGSWVSGPACAYQLFHSIQVLQALSVSVDDLPMKNGQCLGSSQLLSQQRSESKHWSSKGISMYSVVDLRSAISTKQASISMVCKSSRMNAFRNSNFSALLERFWYFSNELCQVPDRAQISPVPCRSPPSYHP